MTSSNINKADRQSHWASGFGSRFIATGAFAVGREKPPMFPWCRKVGGLPRTIRTDSPNQPSSKVFGASERSSARRRKRPFTFPWSRNVGGRFRALALSASGHTRMVNGRAAAGGEKRMDLSEEITWFGNIPNLGDILTERDRSSRSRPVRSFPIRMSVDGSSQRGRVRARPDPAGEA